MIAYLFFPWFIVLGHCFNDLLEDFAHKVTRRGNSAADCASANTDFPFFCLISQKRSVCVCVGVCVCAWKSKVWHCEILLERFCQRVWTVEQIRKTWMWNATHRMTKIDSREKIRSISWNANLNLSCISKWVNIQLEQEIILFVSIHACMHDDDDDDLIL